MNYSKTSKRDISYYNFEQFSHPGSVNKESLATAGWVDNAGWMLPQLTTLLGSKLPLVRVDGLYSVSATLKSLQTSLGTGGFTFSNGLEISMPTMLGMLNVLNHSPRGEIFPKAWKQSSGEGMRYSSSVPLILSAFKECRDIGYSEWDWTDKNMQFLVDKDTLELSKVFGTFVNPFTHEELLDIREIGRTTKSGARLGSKKAYTITTVLTGIQHPKWNELPRLLKLMLCQVWVYHPTVRHRFSITDPLSLDTPATPLVSTDMLDVPLVEQKSYNPNNPWNLD